VAARINLTSVDHLADVETVLEQISQRPHSERPPADAAAIREFPGLAAEAPAREVVGEHAERTKFQIPSKDRANRRGLGWDYHDLLVHRRIAERNRTSDPFALGGRDLVAHPLSDQLAFELGKRQQHIERQPPHAGAANETSWASNSSMSLAKSASERVSRSTL
jgi:hypothetical protein